MSSVCHGVCMIVVPPAETARWIRLCSGSAASSHAFRTGKRAVRAPTTRKAFAHFQLSFRCPCAISYAIKKLPFVYSLHKGQAIHLRYHLYFGCNEAALTGMPTHPAPLTQVYGPDTRPKPFPFPLATHWILRLSAELSAASTLCKRLQGFISRLIGFSSMKLVVL